MNKHNNTRIRILNLSSKKGWLASRALPEPTSTEPYELNGELKFGGVESSAKLFPFFFFLALIPTQETFLIQKIQLQKSKKE